MSTAIATSISRAASVPQRWASQRPACCSDSATSSTGSCTPASGHCPTKAMFALRERLNQLTPGNFPKKTFLVNTGAEAVENAVKIARAYTRRPAIICF